MAQEPRKDDGTSVDPAKLGEDIDRLKEDVRKITETLEKMAGDSAHTASETLRAKARQARASAARAQDAAEHGIDDAVTYARTTIADRPITTVATALGIGVLMGMLLRRH